MEEIWKDVVGYEGLYQVSNIGNVRSLSFGNTGLVKNMSLRRHNKGYRQVLLSKNGKTKMCTVHRLVAEAFIPNPNNLPMVNHKDRNRSNNRVENLEWCTASENVRYSLIMMGYIPREKSTKAFVRKHPKNPDRKNKIIQLDMFGNVLKTWDRCRSISVELNYNQTSIWECCEGKRHTAYGYVWRYLTDNTN